MKRFAAALLLLAMAPLAARADENLGPLALRLSETSLRESALRRAHAEKTTGVIFLAVSVATLVATIIMSIPSCSGSQDSDCGLGLVLPLIATGVNTIVASAVGTALVVTGSIRQSDALRLGVAPTVNPHGGGLGLSLSF
jgi:hypothetical protein